MALNLDRFKRDLLRIRDDLPVTFNFSGTSYTGFAGQKTTRETLEPGGFLDDLDRNLHVPVFTLNVSGSFVNTFPGATPGMGDTLVIVSDGTYKVGNVRRAQDGLLLSYGLETVNR
jgi:hypothetical protein